MITLQYFNGSEWLNVSTWGNESLAWLSLGGDDINYRTINAKGEVLTDKSNQSGFEEIQDEIADYGFDLSWE